MLDNQSHRIVFLCTIVTRNKCGGSRDKTDYECCKDKDDRSTHGYAGNRVRTQSANKVEIDHLQNALEEVTCNNG